MISKLPSLSNKKYKNGVLVCLSDMLGALLEVQQEKLIQK
jgi:hypothetical protein